MPTVFGSVWAGPQRHDHLLGAACPAFVLARIADRDGEVVARPVIARLRTGRALGVVVPARLAPWFLDEVEDRELLSVDISGQRSKSVDELAGQQFDYVITVCDNAKESCPIFPGEAIRLHQSFEDPAAAPPQEQPEAFRRVRDQLESWFQEFANQRHIPATVAPAHGVETP